MQRVSFLGTDEEEEVRRLYGSGFAMRLATERRMAADVGGHGVAGLPTTNMMHDILTGNDMKLQFEDVLSLPEHRPLFVKHLEKIAPGQGWLPSKKDAIDFYRSFEPGNGRIAREFFNRDTLFEEHFEQYPATEIRDDVAMAEDLLEQFLAQPQNAESW